MIAQNQKQNNEIPSNIEAEQHLLGSVLVNNDIIDEIAKDYKFRKMVTIQFI